MKNLIYIILIAFALWGIAKVGNEVNNRDANQNGKFENLFSSNFADIIC